MNEIWLDLNDPSKRVQMRRVFIKIGVEHILMTGTHANGKSMRGMFLRIPVNDLDAFILALRKLPLGELGRAALDAEYNQNLIRE